MSDQLELLPLTASVAVADRPRCRMCARPAWWMPSGQRYALYCTSGACSNRERVCQHCEAPFTMGVDGAGTKYCSRACRLRPNARTASCAWCQKFSETAGLIRRVHWPYVCEECLEPIKHVVPRLKDHKVTHERARRLRDDPNCEVCGEDLLQRRPDGNGRLRPWLVVDHDHACCPGGTHSCGRCVRGLICRHCNAAAGQLHDSADNARSLAAYLDRWRGGA